ncbi:MAG: hypothetical protein DWP97_13620 [Calditrichaeota bacterium]|nr:MAG: hypothetical protein DWP97_13620 [Calditrichota bacterium]
MINTKLLLYCFIAGGSYLFIISLIVEWVSMKLKLERGIPEQLLEKNTAAWFTLNYLMELLFFIVIPSVGYSFFYLVLPFEGMRAGLAASVFALIMGAVPIVMIFSVRVKFPMAYLTFLLLSYFLKLAGAMAIIGYLYTL